MSVNSFPFTYLVAMEITKITCATKEQAFKEALDTCSRSLTKLNVLYLKRSKLSIIRTATTEEKTQVRQEIMSLTAGNKLQTSLRTLRTFREKLRVFLITKMYLAIWIDKINKEIEQLQRKTNVSKWWLSVFEEQIARFQVRKIKLETCFNEQNQSGRNVLYLRLFSNLSVTNLLDIDPSKSEDFKVAVRSLEILWSSFFRMHLINELHYQDKLSGKYKPRRQLRDYYSDVFNPLLQSSLQAVQKSQFGDLNTIVDVFLKTYIRNIRLLIKVFQLIFSEVK